MPYKTQNSCKMYPHTEWNKQIQWCNIKYHLRIIVKKVILTNLVLKDVLSYLIIKPKKYHLGID